MPHQIIYIRFSCSATKFSVFPTRKSKFVIFQKSRPRWLTRVRGKMSTTVHKFGISAPIQCHAWSGDRSGLAISHNNNAVEVHQRSEAGWQQVDQLDQHDLRVNDIDWAPKTDRIVTCSADRNAYVWTKGYIFLNHNYWLRITFLLPDFLLPVLYFKVANYSKKARKFKIKKSENFFRYYLGRS